jgi:hypothetical protein
MNRRIVFAILMAVILLVGALVIGGVAFNAGVAQGIAQSAQVAGSDGGNALRYYGSPFFFPRPFGFGFIGILITLFVIFLVFGVMRRIFWFGSMRMRGFHGWASHWDGDLPAREVPPMFAEWHRQAHSKESTVKTGTTTPQP